MTSNSWILFERIWVCGHADLRAFLEFTSCGNEMYTLFLSRYVSKAYAVFFFYYTVKKVYIALKFHAVKILPWDGINIIQFYVSDIFEFIKPAKVFNQINKIEIYMKSKGPEQ